jgi:hypothetical protein
MAPTTAAQPATEKRTQKPSRVKYVCPDCNGTNVWSDANAAWDEATQQWELLNTFDAEYCDDCQKDVNLKTVPADPLWKVFGSDDQQIFAGSQFDCEQALTNAINRGDDAAYLQSPEEQE